MGCTASTEALSIPTSPRDVFRSVMQSDNLAEELEQMVSSNLDVNMNISHDTIGSCHPIHVAAYAGNLKALKILIEAGADVGLKDNKGQTALFWAIAKSHIEVVEELVQAGSDVNMESSEGITPLINAIQLSTPTVIEILLEKGADPTKRQEISKAVKENKPDIVLLLLQAKADPKGVMVTKDGKDMDLWTWAENENEIEILTELGRNPSERNGVKTPNGLEKQKETSEQTKAKDGRSSVEQREIMTNKENDINSLNGNDKKERKASANDKNRKSSAKENERKSAGNRNERKNSKTDIKECDPTTDNNKNKEELPITDDVIKNIENKEKEVKDIISAESKSALNPSPAVINTNLTIPASDAVAMSENATDSINDSLNTIHETKYDQSPLITESKSLKLESIRDKTAKPREATAKTREYIRESTAKTRETIGELTRESKTADLPLLPIHENTTKSPELQSESTTKQRESVNEEGNKSTYDTANLNGADNKTLEKEYYKEKDINTKHDSGLHSPLTNGKDNTDVQDNKDLDKKVKQLNTDDKKG